jgi:GNAT superfamily N-acetyltransferase/RimJ/RimL family protein N-acetyltransferase
MGGVTTTTPGTPTPRAPALGTTPGTTRRTTLRTTLRTTTARTRDGSMDAWLDRWFEPWAQALRTGLAEGRSDPPLWQPTSRLAALRHPTASYEAVVVAAVDGDQVLGGARVMLPMRDNLTLAELELAVPAEHRRRGVASAVLQAVRAEAAAAGRTSMMTEVDVPLEHVHQGARAEHAEQWPGVAFARAAGMTMRLGDVRRELRVPMPAALAGDLHAQVARAGDHYRLRSWEGFTAPADLDAVALLAARMSVDPPQGDLEFEPEVWDAARVRDDEEGTRTRDMRWWTALAETATGEPAGFTQLLLSNSDPHLAWQCATLVVPEHRGHRLGLALKLRCLEAMVVAEPAVRVVTTWNAESNGPMIAVNEAMGYRPVEVTQEWQGPV